MSKTLEVTAAVFTTATLVSVRFTLSVTVTLPPGANIPKLHVTLLPPRTTPATRSRTRRRRCLREDRRKVDGRSRPVLGCVLVHGDVRARRRHHRRVVDLVDGYDELIRGGCAGRLTKATSLSRSGLEAHGKSHHFLSRNCLLRPSDPKSPKHAADSASLTLSQNQSVVHHYSPGMMPGASRSTAPKRGGRHRGVITQRRPFPGSQAVGSA